MEKAQQSASTTNQDERGELFSLLLRLQPTEPGHISAGSGSHIQAAFLDLIRQSDPALSQWLHTPNQRRPYTLGLLQGFHHLSAAQLADATASNQPLPVVPGQIYWLRITMLDADVFGTFLRHLLLHASELILRIGEAHFQISRVINTAEPQQHQSSWAAYTSFAELYDTGPAQKRYEFEFATPTVFSRGQRSWGKHLSLFPTPALVFENLARQWEMFAPAHLRLSASSFTPRDIEDWCEEQVIVSQYTLSTRYLSSSKFGHVGFQGRVSYEVKGNPSTPLARWLTPLARLALFSGIGYKTTMGMGQARCLAPAGDVQNELSEEVGKEDVRETPAT